MGDRLTPPTIFAHFSIEKKLDRWGVDEDEGELEVRYSIKTRVLTLATIDTVTVKEWQAF